MIPNTNYNRLIYSQAVRIKINYHYHGKHMVPRHETEIKQRILTYVKIILEAMMQVQPSVQHITSLRELGGNSLLRIEIYKSHKERDNLQNIITQTLK